LSGQDDAKVLRARAETRILHGDQEGWQSLVRALAADPRPTRVDAWEREDGPVLAALGADLGLGLRTPSYFSQALSHLRDHPPPSDPNRELTLAASAAGQVPEAAQAARLTEAVLRTATGTGDPALGRLLAELGEDGYRAEVLSLRSSVHGTRQESKIAAGARHQERGSDVPAVGPPVMRLRLPASWLAAHSAQADNVHLRELLDWATLNAELSPAADLEPDGYLILAGDIPKASGRADPAYRYCSNRAWALLPEPARASEWIAATGEEMGIPADLLTSEDALAALLTRPAVEIVAAKYYDVIGELGIQRPGLPPLPGWLERLDPVYAPPLNLATLARRIWDLRGRPSGSTNMEDWNLAQDLLHQFTEEAAFFHWKNRDSPYFDDP
jgi:hypothetical protein